ncbi:MAG: arginine--tRNA ligase [Clostridia bacterium]|nr:arginine--tRNA ligase [Clostridia bacterium]
MKLLAEILSDILKEAFAACGYDASLGQAVVSARPELCQFQCNGALAGAKQYRKSPTVIAEAVANAVSAGDVFENLEVAAPGFLNLTLKDSFLTEYVEAVYADGHMGIPQAENIECIVLDYGNPNVAKPLHVGHLRSVIIGEALKRIAIAVGHRAIGDVHLGDWGLPMGLVLAELEKRYGDELPMLTAELLNEIYPFASKKSKVDPIFLEKARDITAKLQKGDPAYRETWQKMIRLSVEDIRVTFTRLGATFDYWYGESDSSPYVPELLAILRNKGLLTESEGAQVVEVAQEGDKNSLPPTIIIKSNGSEGYATTDVATILQRQTDFSPDAIWYVVDFRQNLHFTQVFRTARRAELVPNGTELTHLCFGTVNGKDGKPFKTRDGGVMQLSDLLDAVAECAYKKLRLPENTEEAVKRETAEKIGIAAIKFGDLINHYSKDCIFDMDKFMAAEGKTGVYLLYVVARIHSILRKNGDETPCKLYGVYSDSERELLLRLALSGGAFLSAYKEKSPNVLCENAYQLAVAFSRFYHENHILSETDGRKKSTRLALCVITKALLTKQLDALGIPTVEIM